MHFTPFLLLAPLLFSGCQEIYTQFCDQSQAKVSCLHSDDNLSTSVLKAYFPGLKDETCSHRFQVTHYEVKQCNNPANALGSDFDGYVNVQVYHKGSCYYRAQMNYKSSNWRDALREVIQTMKKDVIQTKAL